MAGTPSPAPVTRRSRANTRARLVEAAGEVFAAKPFGAVTVDDLVGAAGFTRGAFYSNFSSVQELFHDAYALQSEAMLRQVGAVLDRADTTPEDFDLSSLESLFVALEPYGERWFRLHQEFTLLAVRDAEARTLFLGHVAEFEGRMQEIFGRILDLLGREPVTDLAQISEALMALYLHALGSSQLGTGSLTVSSLVSDLLPPLLMSLSHPR